MHIRDERDLMRWLHGELPPERAARLEARIAREPELARRYRRLAATWGRLELPPAAPAPPGFAARVAARAEEARARSSAEAEAFAPAWVRAAGALAVALGVTAGASLSWLAAPLAPAPSAAAATMATAAATTSSTTSSTTLDGTDSVPSLAEAYWTALSSDETKSGEAESVR